MDTPTGVSFLNIFRSLSSTIGSLFQKDRYIFLSYFIVYAVLLFGIARGIGQYWDWSFPYFSDQVKNVFWSYAFSWLGSDTGAPLPYMSDYYVRMVFSLFGFLPPELFRYILIVSLLTGLSFGVYSILKKTIPEKTNISIYIAGLAVALNPLIFYKLLAGHINYLVSFVLFVYLVYYTLFIFKPEKRRYGLILALFFAFIGAQIQFFVFAALFILIYFGVHKEKRSFQALLFVILITFLINLPWLSNFLVGGIHVSEVSAIAAKTSFKDLGFESYKDILNLTFSKATLIDRFYNPYILHGFSSLFILLLLFVLLKRGSKIQEYHSLFVLLIFVLLGIEFSAIVFSDFYYGKVLLPMFREFGHLGPIVVFFLVLALIQWPISKRERNLVSILLLIFIFVNIPAFAFKLPRADFSEIRKALYPFKEKIDADSSSYRVLTYPFFSPYSFNFLPERPESFGGIALRNAGHDSFTTFSGKSKLSNLVPAYAFYNSPQYLLKQSLDLDVLKPYNVKYIFDMSDVYTSEYKRYISNDLVQKNKSVFEQDRGFIQELEQKNPDVFKKISENIYEIEDASGNVFSFSDLYCIRSTEWNSVFELDRLFDSYAYGTRQNCNPDRQSAVVNLSEFTRKKNIDSNKAELALDLKGLFKDSSVSLYTSAGAKGYYAKIEKGSLSVYQKNRGALKLNDVPVFNASTTNQDVYKTNIDKQKRYYVAVNNKVLAIPENVEVYIGSKADAESFTVYTEGVNQYKDIISTGIPIKAQAKYILSFDYRSENKGVFGYTIQNSQGIEFSNESIMVDSSEWFTYTKVFEDLSDSESVKLEFNHNEFVEYQNLKFIPLVLVDTVAIEMETGYTKRNIDIGQVEKLTYQYEGLSFKNVISNGNFESGLWQKDPIVCHKDNPTDTFAFSGLDTKEKTDGKQSLLLRAKNNVVCAKKTFTVNPNATYVLTFDYKGAGGAEVASYRIDYNDALKTVQRDSKVIKNSNWNTYEKNIQVPSGATSATIYMFARGSGKVFQIENWYDKVSMIELPNVDRSMYIVGKKNIDNVVPDQVWYKKVNPTKTDVTVVKATKPFYLGFSETYHRDWKVRPNITKGGISANPMYTDGVIGESDHYRVNEYFNAWYIDPSQFCGTNPQTCKIEADGSYTMRLTIEFWPQRWFVIFLAISFVTLLVCVLSLIHAYGLGHIDYVNLFRKKSKDIL